MPDGFEDAYAYYLLNNDKKSKDFLHALLIKMDKVVEGLVKEISKDSQIQEAKSDREFVKEIKELGERYFVYTKHATEPGNSGYSVLRIKRAIESQIAEKTGVNAVALRHKLYLVRELFDWLPRSIHSFAGCKDISQENIEFNKEKISSFLKKIGVAEDDISLDDLAIHKSTNRGSKITQSVVSQERDRKRNPLHFYPHSGNAGSMYEPFVRKNFDLDEVDLFDPTIFDLLPTNKIPSQVLEGDSIEVVTPLKSGSMHYTIDATLEWARKNNNDFLVSTGPSLTVDTLLKLAKVFKMNTLECKLSLVKAAIASMALDRHHTIHEVLLVTDADPELVAEFPYPIEGSIETWEKISPEAFDYANKNHQRFAQNEKKFRDITNKAIEVAQR